MDQPTADQPHRPDRAHRRLIPVPVWGLLAAALLISTISGVVYLAFRFRTGDSALLSFLAMQFDALQEHNIATWYASLLWLVLAALALLGVVLTECRISWAMLSAIAILAAIDEYAQLHEWLDNIGNHLEMALGIDLFFTWVLPGVVIAVVVTAGLLPLVLRFPRPQRRLLMVAGTVFLMGAVGVETLSGFVLARFGGVLTWQYYLTALVEETFEFVGVCLAIASLAGLYNWRRNGSFKITLRDRWDDAAGAEAKPTDGDS